MNKAIAKEWKALDDRQCWDLALAEPWSDVKRKADSEGKRFTSAVSVN